MPNIFKQAQQVNEHPKRNNFDLSKKINASFKFGTLYPVYCQPVVPGDSFSIDTAFNLKAMPVVFPVQTKMRAHMHYFYVRNKNLWRNFENWISNLPNATQDLTPHPYISRPDNEFKNGSIHDFLGVPTSVVSDSVRANVPLLTSSLGRPLTQLLYRKSFVWDEQPISFGVLTESYDMSWTFSDVSDDSVAWPCFGLLFNRKLSSGVINIDTNFYYQMVSSILDASVTQAFVFTSDVNNASMSDTDTLVNIVDSDAFTHHVDYDEDNEYHSIILNDSIVEFINSHIDSGSFVKIFFTEGDEATGSKNTQPYRNVAVANFSVPSGYLGYDESNLDLYSNHLHINALPYRAYESCINAFYRNTVVDPLKDDDNNVLYNKYVVNDGDGADTHEYKLFQRNYELDFLTSALPSPQQGVAPMVGVTALGDITIEDENGITTARTESDEAGYVTKVVLTSPAASNEHARTLMNLAASGFNINDFRNTNALQRFLETSIRKGYKYKDFIAGHFGVEPKYVELDMPEFIGGFSRDVSVSTVISNADTLELNGAALGEYGGFAQVVGSSKHSVRHYCDDYGFIIGILCVTPTPCYSQLLPKHMIAPDNFLDYYFAEFSNIGMQPITYKEVAPIQSYLDSLTDSDKSLEDTFGYQRPNYDMVSAVDEVHGEFRGSLRNFVINRLFDTRPELGHDFISIRPEEVNDIFVNTDPRDDTFIGEIGFAVHAKRPVPRVVIPNLGR